MESPSRQQQSSQRKMNAWGQLHALRMEFHRRIEEFKQIFLGKEAVESLGGSSADANSIAKGVRLVEEEFEQYKFKKLAMACFFESSFTRYKVDSSLSGSTDQEIPRSGSHSSISGQEADEDSMDAQLRQQRIMSGVAEELPPNQNSSDQDYSEEERLFGFDEDQLASIQVQPPGTPSGPTARDYEFLKTNLPTLSDLSSEDCASQLGEVAGRLHKEGFFDLLHRSGAISNSEFSITGSASESMSAYEQEHAYDEEELYKRESRSATARPLVMTTNSGRFSRVGKSRTHQHISGDITPENKYRVPNGSMSSDEMKYARSIRRSDLLSMINTFLSNFGISPIQRRDLIWTEWFLGTYLELSQEDRASGRPLLVLDKRSSSTFIDAVKRIYDELFSKKSTLPEQATVKRLRDPSSEDSSLTQKRLAVPQLPGFSSRCSPESGRQSSMLFPGSGAVVVMRPLLGVQTERTNYVNS